MPEVVIAIPTFRRPKNLKRLLDHVAKLRTTANVTVIVADNDAKDHEGFDLCMDLREHYRWPLEPFIALERGIAQVRNALAERALEHANAEFIAMIDDDEWPSPEWLHEHLLVQRETGADALQGAVVFDREEGRGDWAANREGVASQRRKTGPVAMLESSANLFFTRACLESLSRPYFDPAFALTGGEDRDFFVRLKREGRKFAWADQAVVYADVPDVRLTLKWVLSRAYSVGNSDMRVVLKHFPGLSVRAREWAKIAGAVAVSPLLLLAHAPNPRRRLDGLALLFRTAGKVTALFGARYEAYRVTHGE